MTRSTRFKPGKRTAGILPFILQEAVAECRHNKKSAFLALLDVQKAFDTVWHNGLFLKLFQFGIRGDLWHIIYNWYRSLSSAVLWNNHTSRYFPVAQGVRQGAVLSPILYAVFTSDLLSSLESSGLGVMINSIYIGAPTYADDMCLVATSPRDLQEMLLLVSDYAYKWRYSINPLKSQILIISQKSLPPVPFHWHIDNHSIPVVDSAKHLGLIISPSSTIKRTTSLITSSRSAFYSLTAVGARHTCLNPCTSIYLYKSLCLPILTFGLEIWHPTSSELIMMERSQLKILRTILGLPSHVPSKGVHMLSGTIPIQSIMALRQLSFIRNTLALEESSTPRRLLLHRASSSSSPPSSIIRHFTTTLDSLSLPSIPELAADLPPKPLWSAIIRSLTFEALREDFVSSPSPSMSYVVRLPLSLSHYGRPAPPLYLLRHDLILARLSHTRIRLLLKASSLASHTSCFNPRAGRDRSPICTLCSLGQPEDPIHFICICPSLQPIRDLWLPKIYGSTLPDPSTILDHVLGIVWTDQQDLLLKFLADLFHYRATLF